MSAGDQIWPHIPPELLPREVLVVIEVPRFGFIKRGARGEVDFVSPLPCPFNYGSAVDHMGEDGDPADVIVLGPRLARGTQTRLPIVGRVRFRDDGVDDHKWICGDQPPTEDELTLLNRFFSVYALAKLAWRRARVGGGEARYSGIDLVRDGVVVRATGGGTARARFRSTRS